MELVVNHSKNFIKFKLFIWKNKVVLSIAFMELVGRVFSTVSEFYKDLNPATLSGAIDVIVVEHPDGTLHCSPFHVRFGKIHLLRPQEKLVEVSVNGKTVDFPMKVGEAGEAFFVMETEVSEMEYSELILEKCIKVF